MVPSVESRTLTPHGVKVPGGSEHVEQLRIQTLLTLCSVRERQVVDRELISI